MKRFLALLLVLCLFAPSALAAATPTPPPVEIAFSPEEPPEIIRNMLDIAYAEWETLAGKSLKDVNKFTEWRGKGIGFGWCGGFITWCMMEAGVSMEELEPIKAEAKKHNGWYPASGVYHVKEASVGKLLRGYQLMNRSTNIPQPGYLLIYGCSYNKTIHVGLVYEVEELGDGKYRITTIEGNMAKRVKMYVHDYDMYAEDKQKNLSEIPAEEQYAEENDMFSYSVATSKVGGKKCSFYVNTFLMPWVPGDGVNDLTTPTPPPTKD